MFDNSAASNARRKLVLGNWKMNASLAANLTLLEGLKKNIAGLRDVCRGVIVPFPYLAQTQSVLAETDIQWGAQDVSEKESGAYTGEVSASMLSDFACRYVLVGHSERRARHRESSELVASKAATALKAGLTPVVCVGETLAEREDGRTLHVIEEQLKPVFALGAEQVGKLVIAYEPVWAIGTGKTAAPEQAQEVHGAIRQQLASLGVPKVPLLYGGSVKASNAPQLFIMPDIDGGLIGGASLDVGEFSDIVRAALEAKPGSGGQG